MGGITIFSELQHKRVLVLKKPTVYLVDADRAALEKMGAVLAVLDVDIEKFSSAECFLHEERSCESACLVANAALPGLSGLALIEKLKERDMHLPALLIDNSGDVSRAVRAIRAGVIDYIEKPFADNLLLQAVSDVIYSGIETDPGRPSPNP
jgi:FixJ family two-component response regulator